MSFNWNTSKIAQILSLKLQHPSQTIARIITDSRQLKPGDLFVAIQGDTHDGHQFITQAIETGASAIISEKPISVSSDSKTEIFQVTSSLDAIRTLAHFYRSEFSIPVIAVVGAVGKTTTKELIASLLSGKFTTVLKTEGSENGFLGIPLTLLKLKPENEAAVIEIGIDDIGAMEKHLELVRPTHTILTKIGPEHLHQLKTVEIAAEEELRAFDYSLQHQIPMAINLSDEYVSAWFKKHQSKLKRSLHETYSLESIHHPDFLGTYDADSGTLLVKRNSGEEAFSTPLPGIHHAHNLLAAIVLCSFFNLSHDELKKGLSQFKTAYGRTEIYRIGNEIDVIGDHYNSNPTSLLAALTLLTSKKGAPHFHAVLGDMLELGDGEEKFHRDMASSIIQSGVTHVWLYGNRMKWLADELKKLKHPHVSHFETHEALTAALKSNLSAHDQVLVKGSRGMKMEKVLKALLETGSSA